MMTYLPSICWARPDKVFHIASFAGAIHRVIINPEPATQRKYLSRQDDLINVMLFLSGARARVEFYQRGHRIKRCGSGTLAAVHVLYRELALPFPVLTSAAGDLCVRHTDVQLGYAAAALPARASEDHGFWQSLVDQQVLNAVLLGDSDDYCLLELLDETVLAHARVDLDALQQNSSRAVILTAPSDKKSYHYLMRYFAPQYGLPEGEVTASVNVELATFWAQRFNRRELTGRQLSPRGAVFRLLVEPPMVWVMGKTRRLELPEA